jgi:hypothetical protein
MTHHEAADRAAREAALATTPLRPRRVHRFGIVLPLVVALLSDCYEYRTTVAGTTPATNAHRTEWSVFWGLAKKSGPPVDCNGQTLQEVTVRDNLGFALLTVVSLGIVSPKRVEWSCATPTPSEGGLSDAQGE